MVTKAQSVMFNTGSNRSSQMPASSSPSILQTVMMHGGRFFCYHLVVVIYSFIYQPSDWLEDRFVALVE